MFAEQILDSLDTLTLPELKQVQARVNALVETIEEWQRPAGHVVEVQTIPGGCLRLEWVKCGKERCKKCSTGTGHGPYWYRYLGKEAKQESPHER